MLTDYLEKGKLDITDTKNGYLEVKSADGTIQDEVALFRKDDGSALILISRKYFTDRSFTGFDYAFTAKELSKFDDELFMKEVSEEVLPSLSGRENLEIFNNKKKHNKTATYVEIIYKLPRKGSVIQVIAHPTLQDDFKEQVKIYELHLSNDKFIIVKK